MIDDEKIVSIYNELPPKRKEVLNRVLVGWTKKEIGEKLCKDSMPAVRDHLKQLYKNFDNFLIGTNEEEHAKYAELIRVFYAEAPTLVAQIRAKYETPKAYHAKRSQFRPAIELANEYSFELQRIKREEIPTLQRIGRRYFETEDHLPTALLESWFDKDPNSFRKMQNKNGRIVGFFIVLFVKAQALSDFARGRLIEADLDASRILSSRELQKQEDDSLLLSAVIGEINHAITNICILLYLARYIDLMRSSRRIAKVYATAATDSGRRLMNEHLGFTLYTPGSTRRDSKDFFELDINQIDDDMFTHLIERFPSFKNYSRNMELGNEAKWKPEYWTSRLTT